MKQKLITVLTSLDAATNHPIIDQLAEKGYVVKSITSSSFDSQKQKSMPFSKPMLAVTILFEKEEI